MSTTTQTCLRHVANTPLFRRGCVTLALATLSVLWRPCGSGSDAAGEWSGTMDTLPSGEIVVRNADDPFWTPEEAWSVVEDLRIGESHERWTRSVRGHFLLRCRRMGPDLRLRPSGAGGPRLRLGFR